VQVSADRAYRTRLYPYLERHQKTSWEYWHNRYDGMGYARENQATKKQQEEAVPILRRLDPSPGRQPALQHPGPAQGEPQYP
jgi:hypothetical protein